MFQMAGHENLREIQVAESRFSSIFKFYMSFVIFHWKSVIAYINGVLKLFPLLFFLIGTVGYLGFATHSYRMNTPYM